MVNHPSLDTHRITSIFDIKLLSYALIIYKMSIFCLFGDYFIPLLCKGKIINIMTDNKKEVERAELHRTIWAIADEMRGSVDG